MSKQNKVFEQKMIKDIPFEYRDKKNLVEDFKGIGYTDEEAREATGQVDILDHKYENYNK